MSVNWGMIAERRMLAAVADGMLDHLEGAGKPLPEAAETPFVDASEAVGYRMMAEAGYLPAEVELRKKLAGLRADWAEAGDPAEKARLLADIADTSMKEAIAREARLGLYGKR